MKISDFLSPANVMLDVRASDKSRLLHQLSTLAAAEVGLDAADVSKQIAKREELGSTGVGNGVAFPHARLKGLKAPSVCWLGSAAASTLKPSTTSRSISCSCFCCLMRLMTRSSMRSPVSPAPFKTQEHLGGSVAPPLAKPSSSHSQFRRA